MWRDDCGFGGKNVIFGGLQMIIGGMIMNIGGTIMTKRRDECGYRRDKLIPHFEFGTPGFLKVHF